MSELLSQHTTDAAVLACVDFRFWKQLPEAIQQTFGVTEYDDVKIAGGAGNLLAFGAERAQTALADLALAVNAHEVKNLILLTHQMCGKYASIGATFDDQTKELEFHTDQLWQARDVVRQNFPDTTIRLGFAHIEDESVIITEVE